MYRRLAASVGLVLLLATSHTLAQAQERRRPDLPFHPDSPMNNPPIPVAPSDQTLVAGSVHINNTDPALTLHDTATHGEAQVRNVGGDLRFSSVTRIVIGNTRTGTYNDHVVVKQDGHVGVGTQKPAHRLSIGGGPVWTTNGWKGAVDLENAAAIGWSANAAGYSFGMGHTNDGFFLFRTGSQPATRDRPALYDLAVKDDGVVSVNVLEIQGGTDLAEDFDVRGSDAFSGASGRVGIQAGLVVSIDPRTPGALVVSERPYDRRVAGVISGAGGINAGLLLGQARSKAAGRHPVALTGRVYCWADAADGPIAPGDLLTTSATPGHAMKVARYPDAQGAIIGKAMTGLDQGRGLVLVLVTLQ